MSYTPKHNQVKRFPWTDEQIKQVTECSASINLNDNEKWSEKQFIASLADNHKNGGQISEKQGAQLAKIYKAKVLCTPDRPQR